MFIFILIAVAVASAMVASYFNSLRLYIATYLVLSILLGELDEIRILIKRRLPND